VAVLFMPFVLWLPKLQIIWLSDLSILSIPDAGFSRNASYALNLIFTFLLKTYLAMCVLLVISFGFLHIFSRENVIVSEL
jgi:hypothetical protein